MLTVIISSLSAPVLLLVFCMYGTETNLLQGKMGRSTVLDFLVPTDCSFPAQGAENEKESVEKVGQ